MNRRKFLTSSGAISLAATLLPASAWSANLAQVSAVQRFKVGEFTVTALSDGFLELNAGLFPALSDADFQAALAAAFLQPGAYQAAVNAYVIDDGNSVRLIDAGGGPMAPSVGKITSSLTAAGYSPDQVQSLIMTHLHPDHVGGAAAGGQARFANAELVVNSADHAFWTNADIRAQVSDDVKVFFDMAKGAVDAYGERVRQFEGEADIAPGLRAMPLPGHTPGHTGYLLSSGNSSMLIWGDIIHAPPVQFANPAAGIVFDTDGETAAATRARVLDMASADRLTIAGMHLSFPGVGHISKTSSGGYHFHPATWQYLG